MKEIKKNIEKLRFSVREIQGNNPELKKTSIPFVFPDTRSPKMRLLRSKFSFPRVVKTGDEFKDQVNLARWVHRNVNLRLKEDKKDIGNISDPLQILDISKKKQAYFYCTHYSIVFEACANSIGFVARKLSVSTHCRISDDSPGHGTNEIYSTKFRKWFVIDSMLYMYYLKNGIPLNAYELACEWQKNNAKNVEIISLDGEKVEKSDWGTVENRHEASNYYFFSIPVNMDIFADSGGAYPSRRVFFRDSHRKRHIWWRGTAYKKWKDEGYSGSFYYTSRLDDVYFDVNTVRIFTRPVKEERTLAVSFYTFTPSLSHFVYRINKGKWQKFSGQRKWTRKDGGFVDNPSVYELYEIPWKIKKGENSIEVKPVNLYGREGVLSSIIFAI